MFAPSDETIDTVRSWLIVSGIGEERIAVGRTKGWIQVNATVEEAEQLMNAEYNVYTHISGAEHAACEVYHLPEHVQPHVDFVTPSVHFDGIGIGLKTTGMVSGTIGELEECDRFITPICLRALCGLFYEPIATDKNSYGIVEHTPQAYLPSDLQMFAKNYFTVLIGKKPSLVSTDGGHTRTTHQGFDYNGESKLDLQYGMSLGTGDQLVTPYQTGASFGNFLDAIDGSYCNFEGGDNPKFDGIYPDTHGPKACGTVKPAYVISTSCLYNEADPSPPYNKRQQAEYAKLGLLSITVLYSSRDYGVGGIKGLCLTSTGVNGQIFHPGFPGTCPYVTSVGATMVNPRSTVFDPEVACMEVIYSVGGFSNEFAMPDYQKDAVEYYLTNHRPNYPSTIWNSTGTSRAFPDISANGANYVVAVDGQFQLVYGTSASFPVLGAILTMINDARLAVGKGPIGFINPTIYSPGFADAFHDISEGTNPGCGTLGYNASHGWGPVTGLGTPNFPKLLALWSLLP